MSQKVPSFGRKTWDREEYLEKARARYLAKEKESTADKKVSKYEFHKDRELKFHQIDEMNSVSVVSLEQSAITGKRGKGIGFYCEICNLTFKDDLEFVDHLNSKQHFSAAGILYVDSKDITLDMIKDRVEKLAQDRRQALLEKDDGVFDLKKRIELRKLFEEKLLLKRRLKKLKRREKAKLRSEEEGDNDMISMMGFKGFGTTKS